MNSKQYEKRKRNYLKSRMKSYKKHLEKQRSYDENHYLQQIRFSNKSGSHINCFRASSNETDEHIIEKFLKWLELIRRGHRVITEAIFNDSGRADLIDLSEGVVYEVMKSESEKSIEDKIKKYPSCFELKTIKVKA